MRACRACGWWKLRQDVHGEDAAGAYSFTNTYGAVGSLLELDLRDQSTPIAEIEAYLVARFEARGALHPSLCEEVVASVYRNLGYLNVRVTGRAHDGGVDVIMESPEGTLVGVQVKQTARKIGAEPIRAFTGALVLKGLTKGVFVTTSDFTAGAQRTATLAGSRGIRVDLTNAVAFFDALRLARRAMYVSAEDPSAPYVSASLQHIRYKRAFR